MCVSWLKWSKDNEYLPYIMFIGEQDKAKVKTGKKAWTACKG